MGRQIEGHRQTGLPCSKIVAIKLVGGLCRGKSGILAQGPGASRVHGGARAAHERRESGQRVQVL